MSNNKYNHFCTVIGFVSKKEGAESAVTIKEFRDRQYASFTLKVMYGADSDIAVYYGVSIPAAQASLVDNLAPGSRVAVSGSLSVSKKSGGGHWYNIDNAVFLGQIPKVGQSGADSKPAKPKSKAKAKAAPVVDDEEDEDFEPDQDPSNGADMDF